MNKPHKHAEVIKAWADGAEIEYRNLADDRWIPSSVPMWHNHLEYRVKPKPHKHQEVIDAYNRGEECQYYSKSANKWCDFLNTTNPPLWYEDYHYRVKPKVKTTVKYLWSTPEGVVISVLMSEEQKKSTSSYDNYSVKLEWSRTEFKEEV